MRWTSLASDHHQPGLANGIGASHLVHRGRHSARLAVALIAAVGLLAVLGGRSAAAITPAEAKAFFKEFDDATLRQTGPAVTAIYGPGAAGVDRLGKDTFDGAGAAADKAIKNLILDANGKPVPAADKAAVDDAYKKLKDSGAMGRLSQLQLTIINKHFKKPDGTTNFASFQEAMELFANGEIRGGAGGVGEMNQMYQWVAWKQFAEAAINAGVDKASWEKILKSLQKGLEIYRKVYPAPAGASGTFRGELEASDPDRFDATKQLTAAQKTALRTAIDALSTAEILTREKNLINDMTTAAVDPGPQKLEFASVLTEPSPGGFIVDLTLSLTDGLGNAIDNATVSLLAREIGFVLEGDDFSLLLTADPLGGGFYSAEFFAPGSFTGIAISALDEASLAFAATAVQLPIPEPSSLMLFALAGIGLLAGWHRARSPVRPTGAAARGATP